VRHWRKLAEDPRYRRAQGRALIEGPHLLQAALQHGRKPLNVLATETGVADPEIGKLLQHNAIRPVLVTETVLRSVADAESPQGVAAEIEIPAPGGKQPVPAVFLEGVQDPANVGAILRTAAAFGVRRVVLDQACADPWSPKALRAGMGGHFTLEVQETRDLLAELDAFPGTVLCTVVRGGVPLPAAKLNGALAWVFGAEGAGLSEAVVKRADVKLSIPIGLQTDSLNVAASAAICLYEAFRRGP